jgi:hypothetical protein
MRANALFRRPQVQVVDRLAFATARLPEQGAVRRLLVVKLIDGRIHQGYYMVKPVNRPLRLACVWQT